MTSPGVCRIPHPSTSLPHHSVLGRAIDTIRRPGYQCNAPIRRHNGSSWIRKHHSVFFASHQIIRVSYGTSVASSRGTRRRQDISERSYFTRATVPCDSPFVRISWARFGLSHLPVMVGSTDKSIYDFPDHRAKEHLGVEKLSSCRRRSAYTW